MQVFSDPVYVNARQGGSVAIAGNTIVIGAPYAAYNGVPTVGLAAVLTDPGDHTWPPGSAVILRGFETSFMGGGRFGAQVAISGSTIAVAGPRDPDHGTFRGSVRLFERAGGVWHHSARVTTPTPTDYIQLGATAGGVSLAGDTRVVGAPFMQIGATSLAGAVFVYRRTTGGWAFVHQATSGRPVGVSVAVSGSTIAVGEPAPTVDAGRGVATVLTLHTAVPSGYIVDAGSGRVTRCHYGQYMDAANQPQQCKATAATYFAPHDGQPHAAASPCPPRAVPD